MNADRRSKRGPYRAVCLLAALAVALVAQPLSAAPPAGTPNILAAPSTDPVPTRIEGQVRSMAGDTWQVDEFTVKLAPNTTVYQTKGAAAPGAWVLVSGTAYQNYLAAEVIEVLRPAGAPAPTYQLTGALLKMGNTGWLIGGNYVLITESTKMLSDLSVGELVRATVRRADAGLEALEIKELAPDPAGVRLAIEGVVQQVTDNTWVIDDATLQVPPAAGMDVNQGDTVEVAAVNEAGTLVAKEVRKVDPSREASLSGYVESVDSPDQDMQTWTLTVFEGSRATTKMIRVTPETYVDEARAIIEPDVEADVQGENTGTNTVKAALVRLDRPVPAAVAGVLTAGGPAEVWSVGGQQVWFGSEQMRTQALATARQKDGAGDRSSSEPDRVFVRGLRLSNGVVVAKQVMSTQAAQAAGLTADAVASPMSVASAAIWQGPNEVSPALEKASKPTVLFDPAGGGHAVYESMGRIYYSYQAPGGSWSEPKKIGTGVSPSAVLDAKGRPFVGYRSEFLNNYDIMSVHKLANGAWTLPTLVAPTTGPSADPALAADASGKVYVAWMDMTSGEWAIQVGIWDGSYWTCYPAYYARGKSPALAVKPDGALFLAWQDRIPQPNDAWGKNEIFASERTDHWTLPVNVSDNDSWHPGADSIGVGLTTTPDGLAHLGWIDNGSQVRYLFGRMGYWPVPINVGPERSSLRGLSMRSGGDGLLYLAWAEGDAIRVTASPPRTANWPAAEPVATLDAQPVGDVSLTANAGGLAISWVQQNGGGRVGVYESRRDTVRQLLKYLLPMLLTQ